MTKWGRIHHFTEKENWGEPHLMNDLLLVRLDSFRNKVAAPFVVTCGTQGKHAPKSAHYTGYAVDGLFPKHESNVLDMLHIAIRLNFHGIGYYPEWEYNGEKVGGWHLDVDPRRIAMWLGIGPEISRKYHID